MQATSSKLTNSFGKSFRLSFCIAIKSAIGTSPISLAVHGTKAAAATKQPKHVHI
jgi:hypothetical protein